MNLIDQHTSGTAAPVQIGTVLVVVGNDASHLRNVDVYFRTYGLFDIHVCSVLDFYNALLHKFWSLVVIEGAVADTLNASDLNALATRCGCVYIEAPSETYLSQHANRVSVCHEVAPQGVSIHDEKVVNRLNHLLSGYQTVDGISLDPISYLSVNGSENVVCTLADHKDMQRAFSLEDETSEFSVEISSCGSKRVAYLIRRGNTLISAIPVLQIIIDGYLIPELSDKGYRFSGTRNREALELTFLHLLVGVAADNGLPVLTVEPWPSGVGHILTLRQDYDRAVDEADWNRTLNWQESIGIRASWYFLAYTADAERMRQLADRGHEVSYHYRDIVQHAEQDLRTLREMTISHPEQLGGATCHGGNYRGASDVRWLEDHGFSYTEALGRCSLFPYQGLYQSGAQPQLSKATPILSARHVSVDVSVQPPKADLAYLRRTHPARERMSAHTVIMNHPDINFRETVDAVEFCRTANTAFWTQQEVADWWRNSHCQVFMDTKYDPSTKVVTRRIRHDALSQPVFRLWADASGDRTYQDDAYGKAHCLFAENHFEYVLHS